MPLFRAGQTSIPLLGWADARSPHHLQGPQATRQLDSPGASRAEQTRWWDGLFYAVS